MARLQVLFLPTEKVGEVEQQPFALVFDQCDQELAADMRTQLGQDKSLLGARGVLVFPGTVDLV